MIQETIHEICVVVEYPDDKKFCIAKFMHEEDARAYIKTRKDKEYVKHKLYKRYGSSFDDDARWEPLE